MHKIPFEIHHENNLKQMVAEKSPTDVAQWKELQKTGICHEIGHVSQRTVEPQKPLQSPQ